MTFPYRPGPCLKRSDWEEVRRRAIFEACKWDVESDDHCVLANFPLLLETHAWRELSSLSERLTQEALWAEKELLSSRTWRDDLGLPSLVVRALRGGDTPPPAEAARVMRFDFHLTTEGWKISEVNCDVPGGFIEAGGFTQIMAPYFAEYEAPPDPACRYAAALRSLLGSGALVAMVHATAYSDDRQVMEFLARRFHLFGLETCAVSPAHVAWCDGQAEIRSRFAHASARAIVRFFPAEWLPNLRHRGSWEPFFRGSQTPQSNPASAVIIQSKRFPLSLANLGELPAWRRLLPETRSPEDVPTGEMDDWVIKPALGRVGDDVAIAGVTPTSELRAIRRAAIRRPSKWVAQKRFEAIAVESEDGPFYACLGVFTIDGKCAGIYGRVARKPLIDQDSQDVAVLIEKTGAANC
jgi:glutathionylspermidine synthase